MSGFGSEYRYSVQHSDVLLSKPHGTIHSLELFTILCWQGNKRECKKAFFFFAAFVVLPVCNREKFQTGYSMWCSRQNISLLQQSLDSSPGMETFKVGLDSHLLSISFKKMIFDCYLKQSKYYFKEKSLIHFQMNTRAEYPEISKSVLNSLMEFITTHCETVHFFFLLYGF